MAGEDPRYTAWIRSQGCHLKAQGNAKPCFGRIEAHHPTYLRTTGSDGRAHDNTAIPLCAQHHAELHSLSGVFRGMTRDVLRIWQGARIDEYRGRYVL
jgi:hypothetical protein